MDHPCLDTTPWSQHFFGEESVEQDNDAGGRMVLGLIIREMIVLGLRTKDKMGMI